jgi:multiple sugar transport system substrate-binding protein
VELLSLPDSKDDVQEIVFIPGVLEWEMGDTYQALIEEFQRTHPSIVVKLLPFSAMTEGGISSSPQELVPDLAEKGDCFVELWIPWSDAELANFLVLDPLLDADVTFPTDDFYPFALTDLRVKGQLMGLPKTIYPWMMFYNEEAFDAAGSSYPAPGWDPEDFITPATSLTKGEGADKRYGYLPYPSLLTDAAFFIEQSGARPIDDSTDPTTFHLDAPATIDAVRWWYSNLSLTYDIIPEPRQQSDDLSEQYDEWEATIRSGRAAMWSSFSVLMAPRSPFENTLEVGVAPMPQGPGQMIHFMLMAYCISAQTEHPQACWEWLKFLTEQPELFSPYDAMV